MVEYQAQSDGFVDVELAQRTGGHVHSRGLGLRGGLPRRGCVLRGHASMIARCQNHLCAKGVVVQRIMVVDHLEN